MRRVLILALAVASAFTLAWSFGRNVGAAQQKAEIVKNLPLEGDVEGTLQAANRLLSQLRQNDWNSNGIDRKLLRVPDQAYHPNIQMRASQYPSFCIDSRPFYAEKIAFFSNLYVTEELQVVPGSEGILVVDGFYIVGWKDGQIQQVPASAVRLCPIGDSLLLVFPGMDQYDPALPSVGDPNLKAKLEQFKKEPKLRK